MQPGSAKLEWRCRLDGVGLHSSLVDPDCMLRPSQWSSKIVILAGQAGQGNASLTEILRATVWLQAEQAELFRAGLRKAQRGPEQLVFFIRVTKQKLRILINLGSQIFSMSSLKLGLGDLPPF